MSVAGKVKSGTAGIAVGVLVGGYIYARESKAAEASLRQGVCANAPPGALQSLGDAIKGASSHFAEDFALGSLGLADALARMETFGLWQPDTAADFYSWWNGLSPAQQAQVRVTEDGNLTCVAAETAAQLATGGSALLDALAAGAVAYLVASAVLE